MFFSRKPLYDQIAELKAEIALLKQGAADLQVRVDKHDDRLTAMKSKIVLKTPGSPYALELSTGKGHAGIWVVDHRDKSQATIQNTSGTGAVVGVYGPFQDGPKLAMDAAMSADLKGGHIQLMDGPERIIFIEPEDFGPGFNLKPDPQA